MLQHYRTLTRKPGRELPYDLLLLDARVAGKTEDAAHSEPWGRTEGVVFDDDKSEIAFFVVCVYRNGAAPRRVLVPLNAVELVYPEGSRSMADAVLRVDWTPDQLHAQPTFAADGRLPEARWTGGPPPTSRWMPARPNVVPPGEHTNWAAGRWYALLWGFAAAAAGAVFGLLVSGLLMGATLALFFGIGSAIAGFMYGASRESAADASEFVPSRPPVVPEEIERLEGALRDPDVLARDVLQQTPIAPTAVPPRRARPLRAAHAR